MMPRRAAIFLSALLATPWLLSAQPAQPAEAPVETVIESGAAELVSTEKETTFTFSQGVKVTATNMILTCQDLVVVARRAGDPSATLGDQQNFKSLVATGGVRIVQNDREAIAERAEVFPDEDRVVLSGNPIVRSIKDGWEQSGPGMQLILHRGERRAVMQGPPGTRSLLKLPPLKDLGYESEDAARQPTPEEAATPESPSIRVPNLR